MFQSLAENIWGAWIGALSLCAMSWGLERLFPARKISFQSQLRSLGYWVIMGLGTGTAVTAFGALSNVLHPHPLLIVSLKQWLGSPAISWSLYVVTPLTAVILYDFFDYWMHRAQHKWFWKFHAIHHSIEELSGINSYFHWTEQFFRVAFISLPAAYLIGLDAIGTVFAMELLVRIQGYYLHSPTSIHFGPAIRRVIADNRFHRIHHSIHTCHFDKNFGAGTTVWDQLFGTAYFPARNEWPDTGMTEQPETRSLGEYLWGPFRIQFSTKGQFKI